MYMPEQNFSPLDFAVSRAIPELHEEKEYISGEMIAEHIGCTSRSVYKSLRWMKSAKLIKVIDVNKMKGGSIYEYVGTR